MVTIFIFFAIPLQLAFEFDFHKSTRGDIALSVFFLDILITMNTSYYDKGQLIY